MNDYGKLKATVYLTSLDQMRLLAYDQQAILNSESWYPDQTLEWRAKHFDGFQKLKLNSPPSASLTVDENTIFLKGAEILKGEPSTWDFKPTRWVHLRMKVTGIYLFPVEEEADEQKSIYFGWVRRLVSMGLE